MDYNKLFDRWVVLTTLPEADRSTLMSSIHEEVTSGVQALAGLAVAEMAKILEVSTYEQKDAYSEAVAPVVALGVFDGYLLALMERGVNPQTEHLVSNEKTKDLGERWSARYEKDQTKSYLEKIDPIVGMILNKMYELRVNQILSFHPEIVNLPYKVTEKLHQYIDWAVHQGYVLGVMEQENVQV